jgi:hypothetical protein
MQTLMTSADEPISLSTKQPGQLTFGYLDYPRFSGPNGKPTKPIGLSVELINRVAGELGLDVQQSLYGVECKWSTFKDNITEQDVDIVVDPIVRTGNRNTLSIIPYAKVKCFVLLFHRLIEPHVAPQLRELAGVMADLALRDGPWRLEALEHLEDALMKVPLLGTRFVVGAGQYERDFLDGFGIPCREYSYNGSAVSPIIHALKDKTAIVMTDEPFALAALQTMKENGIHDITKMDLFTAPSEHHGEKQRAIQERLDSINYQYAGFAMRYKTPLADAISSLHLRSRFRELCADKGQNPESLGVRFIEESDDVPPILPRKNFVIPYYGTLVQPLRLLPPPSDEEDVEANSGDLRVYAEAPRKGLSRLFGRLLNTARAITTATDPQDFELKTIDLWAQFKELNTFLGISASHDELMAVLQVVPVADAGVLTLDKLASLIDVLTWLHESTGVTDALLDRIEDRLEAEGFDLESPMGFLQRDD